MIKFMFGHWNTEPKDNFLFQSLSLAKHCLHTKIHYKLGSDKPTCFRVCIPGWVTELVDIAALPMEPAGRFQHLIDELLAQHVPCLLPYILTFC